MLGFDYKASQSVMLQPRNSQRAVTMRPYRPLRFTEGNNIMITRFSLFASATAIAAALPAVAAAGEIEGTVIDASETVALRAAQVRLVELDRVASTERDGSFLFADVPAGSYTLEVSYIGAKSSSQTVEVPETGVARPIAVLGGTGSNQIFVIGQSANLASALSRKRAADGISDVLTRDAIGQFPDQNVAESLRRLPGVNILNDQGEGRFVSVRGLDPELVSTSLNGVRLPAPESDVRSVALDVISSDIIESIEVKKSLTPDMDADTIGASVEIETTSAFGRRKDLLTVKLEGSYNQYSEKLTPKGSLDFAYRLGDNIGVAGGLSYYKREFETDNIEADDWIDEGAIVPLEVQYRDYDVERERISATLSLDVKAGDNTELFVKGLWSQFDDQEYRRRLTFDLGDFEDFGPTSVSGKTAIFSDTTILDADDEEVRQRIGVERDIKDRFERQRIRSITLGGKTETGTFFAEYSGSYAKSTEKENGSVDPAEFRQRFSDDGLVVGFDYTYPRRPLYSIQTDTGSFFDPAAYELNDIEYTALSDSQDEEWAAQLDLGRRFAMASGELTVQAGAKGRWREKSYDKTVEFYENDTLTLADVLGQQTYRLYNIDPLPNYTGATDYFLSNFDDFEFQDEDSFYDSAVEDYSAKEDVLAGYLMGRWENSDLLVIGGVRYEHTSTDLTGNIVYEADVFTPVEQSFENDYDHWLPSLNLRWEAQDDLIFRLAGYRSIVRPKLSKLAPRAEVNEDDEIEVGNPDLKPYEAWNFDASAEYYLSSNGAITAGLFYKDVKNYIVDRVVDDGVFNDVTYPELSQPINGESAEIFGFELGLAQAFTGALDGFIIQANYTYTDAEGTVFIDGDITDPRKIPLPATSRHTANISLGYDKGPIDIRLSGTYRDKYLDELNDEAEFDRYVDDHFQLDLSAKFRANDHVQFFYEWININNAKYFAYNRLGGQQNLLQYEEYSWTMKGGVRFTF